MPLDIVTPPISSSVTRPDRWQVHLPRDGRRPTPDQGSLFEAASAPEAAPVQTQHPGSSIAFLAQSLAQTALTQASNTSLVAGAATPASRAASVAQRYEIAGSRDAILRGESILFRFSV
jgi:hypothetical protein